MAKGESSTLREIEVLRDYVHRNETALDDVEATVERQKHPIRHALKNALQNIGIVKFKTGAEKAEAALDGAVNNYDAGNSKAVHEQLGAAYRAVADVHGKVLADVCEKVKTADQYVREHQQSFDNLSDGEVRAGRRSNPALRDQYIKMMQQSNRAGDIIYGGLRKSLAAMSGEAKEMYALLDKAEEHYKAAGDKDAYLKALQQEVGAIHMVGDAVSGGARAKPKAGKLEKAVATTVFFVVAGVAMVSMAGFTGAVIGARGGNVNFGLGLVLFLVGLLAWVLASAIKE